MLHVGHFWKNLLTLLRLCRNIYLSGVRGIELIYVDIIFEVTPWYATPIAKRVHPLDNTLEWREESC